MSALTAGHQPAWRIPRPPLQDWLFITLCGWGALLLGVVLVGNLIDHWSWIASLFGREVTDVSVTYSIWSVMAGIAIWYVGFVGGYYLHNYLPAFVAAGRTRRISAIEAGIFCGVISLVGAVLVTLGYLWERVVYAIAGWSRGTPDETILYFSFNDYGRILITEVLTMTMWIVGGAFIGSAFYRSNFRGAIAIAIALIAVNIVGGNSGLGAPTTFFTRQLDLSPGLPLTFVVTTVSIAVLGVLTWWNVKDVPLRNK